MAAKAGSSSETIAEINMIPLIDIILVVLIIFMVTAPALMKPSVPISLPEAASGDETQPSLLNIALAADGTLLVNNSPVDEDQIRALAAEEFARNPDVQALIIADQSLPYGEVIRVLDWVKSSGVKNFAVSTDQSVN